MTKSNITTKTLRPYSNDNSNRIGDNEPYYIFPIRPWNSQTIVKTKSGEPRVVPKGKTPFHAQWDIRNYKQTASEYKKYAEGGLNLGVRLGENDLVIDCDPRNYEDGIDSEQRLATMLGYESFDAMLWENMVAKTGGGGYHIYCKLPLDDFDELYDFHRIRKAVPELPGIDFKKKGGYVIGVGSRHPNGGYYTWDNPTTPQTLSVKFMESISRDVVPTQISGHGYGSFSGMQLEELVLSKLDPTEYNTNDTWEPFLMSCHHATGGEGLEEFIQWSISDESFQDDENIIRNRWESLGDEKTISRTAGSLVYELDRKGVVSSDVRAVLDFDGLGDDALGDDSFSDDALGDDDLGDDGLGDDGLGDNHDSEDDDGLQDDKTSISEGMQKTIEAGEGETIGAMGEEHFAEGYALALTRTLIGDYPDKDLIPESELLNCLRTINRAGIIEKERAEETLIQAKVVTRRSLKRINAELVIGCRDSFPKVVATRTLEWTYSKGKHLLVEPNGQIWIFKKTHWVPISRDRLKRTLSLAVDTLKDSFGVEIDEAKAIESSSSLVISSRALSATKIFNYSNIKKPVFNCLNGELWSKDDTGDMRLKRHQPNSYLTECLQANYAPDSTCQLVDKTVDEIFSKYEDKLEIIRHFWELFGYMIQNEKNGRLFCIFKGPGGDGKTTLMKIIQALVGAEYKAADENLVVKTNGISNNHATADLVGKKVIGIQELSNNVRLNDALIKKLSENTIMSANPKGVDEFDFQYRGTVVVSTNSNVRLAETGDALRERIQVIPFNQQFRQAGKEDPDRVKTILSDPEEISGVLNRVAQGLCRFKERGSKFLVPESVQAATDDLFMRSNPLARYISEKFILDRDRVNYSGYTRAGVAQSIYGDYCAWCDDNGAKPLGRNTFYQNIEQGHLTVRTGANNLKYIYGGKWLGEEIYDFDGVVDEEGNNMAQDEDVELFIEECLEITNSADCLKARKVYGEYCFWCDDNFTKPVGRNNFYSALRDNELVVKEGGSRTMKVYGVKWVDGILA